MLILFLFFVSSCCCLLTSASTRFPYLLPNVLGSSLALIGLPLVFFFLKETLDVQKRGDRYSPGVARTIEIVRFALLFCKTRLFPATGSTRSTLLLLDCFCSNAVRGV